MNNNANNSVPISKESIKELLSADFFTKPEKNVLAAFLFFKKHEASSTTLAEHLGYPAIGPGNSIVGKMGKRVAERLGIPLRERKDGSEAGWDVLFEESWTNGQFHWRMKKSVVEALIETGLRPLVPVGKDLQIFYQGDLEYFTWLEENPYGYVLNTTPVPHTTTFVLHKSTCFQIKEKKGLGVDAYTKKGYVKVASNDPRQIEKYSLAQDRFPGDFQYCKTCKPSYLVEDRFYPEEILEEPTTFMEGGRKKVTVNYYERNSDARKKCIEHYGYSCQCCGLNFKDVYGEIGEGFIHVHHKRPVAEIGEKYEVDPIEDLVPLCPNCHAMVHRQKPPFLIEELRKRIRSI